MAIFNTEHHHVSFSLLIPCYGNANHLYQMIDSILRNSYKDIEIIICKQGNTEIHLENINSSNIRIIEREKPSSYYSRIDLFKEAKCDYIWFLDDDDEIDEFSLSKLNELINKNNLPDCVLLKSKIFINEIEFLNYKNNEDCKTPSFVQKEDVLNEFLTTNKINTVWGKVFKRNVFPKWIMDFDVFQGDDRVLTHSIIQSCNTFIKFDYPCYKYFAYRSNSLRNKNLQKLQDSLKVKLLLLSFYNDRNCNYLLYDGYLNIKSYLQKNTNLKCIKKMFKDKTVSTFINAQRHFFVPDLGITKKDFVLYSSILKRRTFFIWLIMKLFSKRKEPVVKTYQHVSLGYNCSVAYNLKNFQLRSFSAPFDWVVTFETNDAIKCITSKFSNLLKKKYIYQDDKINKWYLNKKTNILFGHDFSSYDRFPLKFVGFKRKMKKRIKRFYKKIKQPTIFYRYCYLPKDLAYIAKHHSEIQSYLKSFNEHNQIVYIIDKTFLNHDIIFPKHTLFCEGSEDWDKLKNCRDFSNFIMAFQKHDKNKTEKTNFLIKIFHKIYLLIIRQKNPYNYKRKYEHFEVY